MSPSSKRRGEPPPPARRFRPPRSERPASKAVPADAGAGGHAGTGELGAPGAAPEYDDYDYDDGPPEVPYAKIGAGAGIAYALLGFIGASLLPVGKVDPTNTAEQIARQLVTERGRVSAGILLTLFSLFFLIVFVAWLHRWLRSAEGEDGWFSTVSIAGGVLQAGMLSVVVGLSIAATVLDSYGPDVVVARTLLVLQWQAIAIVFVPTAAFVGGASLVGYTTGQLPRWLCYVGLGISVGLLIPPLAFLPFLLSNLWTGLLAVFLFQRSRGRA